jgi:hypothetical protein
MEEPPRHPAALGLIAYQKLGFCRGVASQEEVVAESRAAPDDGLASTVTVAPSIEFRVGGCK